VADDIVDELKEVLLDESKPDEERIKAAKELWRIELTKEPILDRVPALSFVYPIDEQNIYKTVKEMDIKEVPKIEYIVYRGLYEYYRELASDRVSEADISELLDLSVSENPFVREEAKKRLEEIPSEELISEAKRREAIAIRKRAEAILMESESIARNISRVTNIMSLKYLSREQVDKVRKPTKKYAKDAFKSGIWKNAWGAPEDYGIRPDTYVYSVDRPQTKDFVRMAVFKGIWRSEWGDPEEYYKTLEY